MTDNVVAFPGQEVDLEDMDLPDYFRRLAILADADAIECVVCSVVTTDGGIHPVVLGETPEAMALIEDFILGLEEEM